MGFFSDLFSKHTEAEVDQLNPSAKVFNNKRISDLETIVANKYSVIDQDTEYFETDTATSQFNSLWYMPLITDKFQRIQSYRRMALYPEVDWCISEIADDFIHEDHDGKIIKMVLSPDDENTGLTDIRRKVLNEEFDKFINLFNLKEEGYALCKRFVVEGEIAFENIVDPNEPRKGILGVKFLPTDFYETLLNPNNGRGVGIYFNKGALKGALERLSGYTYQQQAAFDVLAGNTYSNYYNDSQIPMLWPQLTYISSGNTSPDGRIVYPLIDQAKQPYHQLALLHDAAVILRVTRAPERLVFNISTGGVSDKIAQQKVREFAQSLNAKRNLNEKNKMSTGYNPVTMLESYYFWKSESNDGTSVETVGSTANYSEMDDIKYFLKRLFKQFKVPYSRYDTPENTIEKNDSITYEEYSFSRLILRIQRRFAQGLKKAFITHLKLREIWGQYSLKDSYIDIEMTRPVLYDLYQSQKMFEIQLENYNSITGIDEISKTLAMKKYLGFTDQDLEENRAALIKEKMIETLIEYYQEQLNTNGPENFTDIPPAIKWKGFGESEAEESPEDDTVDTAEEEPIE